MKTINTSQLNVTNRQFFNNFSLPIWVAVVISISLGFVTAPVRAENIQHYQHIAPKVEASKTGITSQKTPQTPLAKDTKDESATSGDTKSQTPSVNKPEDGKGALPSFAQADTNGDHVVTKSELQNFPLLLKAFDKVDAGQDGKLEQHEYQNLEMETKREGEIQ